MVLFGKKEIFIKVAQQRLRKIGYSKYLIFSVANYRLIEWSWKHCQHQYKIFSVDVPPSSKQQF